MKILLKLISVSVYCLVFLISLINALLLFPMFGTVLYGDMHEIVKWYMFESILFSTITFIIIKKCYIESKYLYIFKRCVFFFLFISALTLFFQQFGDQGETMFMGAVISPFVIYRIIKNSTIKSQQKC